MRFEEELREGLRSHARTFDPQEDSWDAVEGRIRLRRRRRRQILLAAGGSVAVAVLIALAIGIDGGDDVSVEVGPAGSDETRYTTKSMVLESPDHGPQLCLGGVAQSYPPQCGGPDVIGWDWDAVDDEESASGTTWGTYTVVGTWDGDSLTLTEPPSPAPAEEAGSAEPEPVGSSTPCPEPDGGWRVIDETRTSDDSMNRAKEYARSQPTGTGVWLDQSINPAPHDESTGNDPTKLILNLSFTDDLERHEDAIREIWGGALCVSEASISAAELEEIRAEVQAEVGDFLISFIDEVSGQVKIGVVVDDGLQERFDDRYGAGVVEVQARLHPLDP